MDTEKVLSYKRTFVLQSAHFNSQATYDSYRNAFDFSYGLEWGSGNQMNLLKEVLLDIHGHNFKVTVTGIKELVTLSTSNNWVVVWDEELEKLVREWDRVNLSVHPDFEGYRATTEVMAVLLKRKLEKKWDVYWTVEVQETDEIAAVAS